jgi:ABC-type uncharacterized transport system permease subunit
MLSGISFTCFAASYAVGLLLELGRMFYQLGRKPWLVFAFAFAGFFAHTYYLIDRVQDGLATRGLPLSNWYHWCIVAAWVLALIYILLVTFRSENTFGLFLLPLILLLLGISQSFPQDQVFSSSKATRVWGTIHGMGLLFGTVTVAVGFMAGLMYLLQSYRLKHKVTSRWGLRLPSLEWLRGANERCLVWSTFLLVMGVLAGVILNLASSRNEQQVIGWDEPVVWTSGLLVLWLISSVAFIRLYKPAREGRKVAYLTVTSFLVLVMALSAALGTSNHGAAADASAIEELAR